MQRFEYSCIFQPIHFPGSMFDFIAIKRGQYIDLYISSSKASCMTNQKDALYNINKYNFEFLIYFTTAI